MYLVKRLSPRFDPCCPPKAAKATTIKSRPEAPPQMPVQIRPYGLSPLVLGPVMRAEEI